MTKDSPTSKRYRPGSGLENGKLPGHLCYMVFDCLYVNGHSLLNRRLEERQAVLWETAACAPDGGRETH
jgi:ATP-dependent DNA ligase